MRKDSSDLGQPAWDLSDEYSSFDDPRFSADLASAREILAGLEAAAPALASALPRAESLDPACEGPLLEAARSFLSRLDSLDLLLSNLSTYANCVASVDGTDVRAKETRGIVSKLSGREAKVQSSLDLLLARSTDAFAEAFLAAPEAAPHRFRVSLLRKRRVHLLPLEAEETLSTVATDGLHAWGRLYDSITGTARCQVRTAAGLREAGLAEVAIMLRGPDRGLREAAYRAQTEAFALHDESLAAILNAIAGWRLSEYGLRSRTEPYHFLDAALASNRLSRATLDAMMGVVVESRELARRALRLQSRLLGVDRAAPWDLLAPCPTGEEAPAIYSYDEALGIVRAAYASVDPAMGDFVLEMRDRKRLEGRLLPAKRPGAYCTRFARSRTPRVYQSYGGNLADVSTLAHELGHAYHGSLLASLPVPETRYPMNLAETASTFAETALGDWLAGEGGAGLPPGAARARTLEVAWGDAQDAVTFLLNIPVRFEFEKAFYEARAEKPLGPAALSALMAEKYREWFGDGLSEPDPGFWKSKLHFFMSGLSFYNFPYTFGWLFSLGVYSRRSSMGRDFHPFYQALLRDTGRMETEELALRHLGVDLSRPDFWRESIGMVKEKVDRFELLVGEAGGGASPR